MSQRPNVVIFLTDDQGYGDLSYYGDTDVRTPHLDQLAAGGALLTDWYANSPVCSPSRASLLTGRYPVRAGVRSILKGTRHTTGLPPEVPTLAAALKPLGYQTGMFGKWHLGLADGSRPDDHGFDEWFGFMAGCIDYYSHIFYWGQNNGIDPLHDLWENGDEIYENGRYFTDLITERATRFVQRSAPQADPFLMYVPYNAPHYPMHAPKKYMDRFAHLSWDRQVMAAMLSAVDDSIGAILSELERQGQRENTFIAFMSDNGPSRETRNWLDGTPDPYYGGSAGKLKGHKFSLFEGGIRVPGIVNWPAVIPAGQTLSGPAAAMDLFPTILNAAGGDPAGYDLDGQDIMPLLADGAESPHEAIFWEMGRQTAVRQGRWKLVLGGQLVEGAPPEDMVHLADLSRDMGERHNLKDEEPDLCSELEGKARSWRQRIDEEWETVWKQKGNGTVPKD